MTNNKRLFHISNQGKIVLSNPSVPLIKQDPDNDTGPGVRLPSCSLLVRPSMESMDHLISCMMVSAHQNAVVTLYGGTGSKLIEREFDYSREVDHNGGNWLSRIIIPNVTCGLSFPLNDTREVNFFLNHRAWPSRKKTKSTRYKRLRLVWCITRQLSSLSYIHLLISQTNSKQPWINSSQLVTLQHLQSAYFSAARSIQPRPPQL